MTDGSGPGVPVPVGFWRANVASEECDGAIRYELSTLRIDFPPLVGLDCFTPVTATRRGTGATSAQQITGRDGLG